MEHSALGKGRKVSVIRKSDNQGEVTHAQVPQLKHGTIGPRYDLLAIGEITYAQGQQTGTLNILP